MPYFGNATLKHLVDAVQPIPREQRTGQHLLDNLDRMQQAMPVQLPARGPARQVLARASYVQSIVWIGSCLAEALHYAHERGLVHLDIKPSNVLLAVDGQPMLLDFHLAQKPLHPDNPPPEWIGGSPHYMSPEHKAAVSAVHGGRGVPGVVDGRADIYSLGALLYSSLGGTLPFRPEVSPPLCDCNPLVSVGLSDIIQKCLAPDPAQRYLQASTLAGDLQRHLAQRPLVGVTNRSLMERCRKFRRRQPYALPLVGLIVAVTIAAGALVIFQQRSLAQQRHQVQAALQTGQELLRLGRWDEAQAILQQGLSLAQGLTDNQPLTDGLQTHLVQVERGRTAQELANLANRLRVFYGADFLPRATMQELEGRCRLFWENRRLIADRLGFVETAAGSQQGAQTDLLDLALLWCDLRVRLAPKADESNCRREILKVLDQAEELFGPSPVLVHLRQIHAEALGIEETARAAAKRMATLTPRTAWEHYALGRALLQSGDREQASVRFREALVLEPQGFWPNFYLGLCAYQQGQYPDAVAAFSVCVGSAPTNAACFYNRALTQGALGNTQKALDDYDYALRLDPTLAVAALNRGLLYYRASRYNEAAADLDRALTLGADPAAVQYNLALVFQAQGDRARALVCLRRALDHNPTHAEARRLQANLEGR
jgi:tetratricopeptide (TPR) repeat protein